MARKLRQAPWVEEVTIQDQIIVAGSSEGSASTLDVDSPPGQFANSREPRCHPTPARGPKLAESVANTASKLARKKAAAKSTGKVPRVYCYQCQQRKNRPAVHGSRNGNAIHKCVDCQRLTEEASEQQQQPCGKGKAETPAQPEQKDAPVAGKEQPGRPKSIKRKADEPIPNKRELIAHRVPSNPQQKEDNKSEPGTESDDPEKPVIPNRRNPSVDKFGSTTNASHAGQHHFKQLITTQSPA